MDFWLHEMTAGAPPDRSHGVAGAGAWTIITRGGSVRLEPSEQASRQVLG